MGRGDWNIPDSIFDLAEDLNLEFLGTGGGIDYVVKDLGEEANEDGSNRFAYLRDAEDAGSPDTLNSKAAIGIVLNKDWSDIVFIPVKTAKQGLHLMVNMEGTVSA